MLKVGLTGNIGSGKTTVSSIFKSLDVPVIIADDLGRSVVNSSEVKSKLLSKFGDVIFDDNMQLKRKELAQIVFAHADSLKWLNELLHPLIREQFELECLQLKSSSYMIYEAAILYEAGFHDNMDFVVVVSCSEELMIQRVLSRDELSETDVKQRLVHQMKQSEKINMADFVIVNDGTELLIPQVVSIHDKLLSLK